MAVERGFDLLLPLGGIRLDALVDEAGIDLRGGFVDAELDNREVGRGGLQVIADGEAGQIELRLVEFFETAAEVDEHQIALVAEQGEQRALAAFGGRLQGGEGRGGFGEDLGAGGIGKGAPGGAAEAHHLMQHAGAFHSKRDRRDSGGGERVRGHLYHYIGCVLGKNVEPTTPNIREIERYYEYYGRV